MNSTFSRNAYLILLCKAFLLISYSSLRAQCSSQGALSGSIFSDDNSIGVYAFSSPSNAGASDNNRATAISLIGLLSGNTHYLKATSFGFSIPSSAIICGIELHVEKSASNISLLATVEDNVAQLMKAGVIVGNNYATPSNWSTSESYSTYGGPSDLWGTSWGASDINASDFGIAFSARINGIISLLPIARVDHIQIIVYYMIPVPVHFINFTAKLHKNNQVLLEWATADNDEDVRFDVQRCAGGDDWINLHMREGKISSGIQYYSFTDIPQPVNRSYFYRIKMQLTTGAILYTEVRSILLRKTPELKIFPNPATGYIIVNADDPSVMRITTIAGNILPVRYQTLSPGKIRISTINFKPGKYIITINEIASVFIVQ